MKKTIPLYIEEMLTTKASGAIDKCLKFNEYIVNDTTCAFAFITDTHNCMDYTERAFYSIDRINEHYPLSFTCLGGDYLCNNVNTTKEEAATQLQELMDAIDDFKMKSSTMVVIGNHDTNSFGFGESLNHKEIHDIIMNRNLNNFVMNKDDENSLYCYMDIPDTKIRAIFLDSSDYGGKFFTFGNKQINWFANIALDVPDSQWGVVVFSHALPISSKLAEHRVFGGQAIWEILCAFKNGTAYSASETKGDMSYDVSCDFTHKGEGDVIAYFVGHNHADRKTMIDGIRAISTLGANGENMGGGLCDDGKFYPKVLGSALESAFSIFTINRTKRQINFIRCGAGKDMICDY